MLIMNASRLVEEHLGTTGDQKSAIWQQGMAATEHIAGRRVRIEVVHPESCAVKQSRVVKLGRIGLACVSECFVMLVAAKV